VNYYYDVVLNFDLENVWQFYEWEEDDYFTYVKKIPLFRVEHEVLRDFLNYHIRVSNSFVLEIAHKTVVRNSSEDIYGAFLMSDSKNTLAVLLNEQGDVLALSKLMIADDNNVNEFLYTVKKTVIPYEKKEIRNQRTVMRQEEKVKKFISIELNTLLEEKNMEKLRYLYYEWFQEEKESMVEMYQDMVRKLKAPMDDLMLQIFYFIRLSYHQV